MKKGTVVDRPIGAFPQGTIDANHLEISESGSVILFSEGVRTVFVLPRIAPNGQGRNRHEQILASTGAEEPPGIGLAGAIAMLSIAMLSIAPLAVTTLAIAALSQAQASGPPNALRVFAQSHQPIQIDAVSLEVRDKEKVATFAGKVHPRRATRCLIARSPSYSHDAEGKTAQAAPGQHRGAAEYSSDRGFGNVAVTQKDQKVIACAALT